jgi:hypothetical protein
MNRYINFSYLYPKLTEEELLSNDDIFTTIRPAVYNKYYPGGKIFDIKVNREEIFKARIIKKRGIKKSEITDEIAWTDAKMTATKRKNLLSKVYGEGCEDFVILTLKRIREA